MKSVVAFPSSEFKSVTRCEVVALEHRIQGSENKLSILRTTASREFAKEHSALLCRSVRARKDDEEQRLEHIYRIAILFDSVLDLANCPIRPTAWSKDAAS